MGGANREKSGVKSLCWGLGIALLATQTFAAQHGPVEYFHHDLAAHAAFERSLWHEFYIYSERTQQEVREHADRSELYAFDQLENLITEGYTQVANEEWRWRTAVVGLNRPGGTYRGLFRDDLFLRQLSKTRGFARLRAQDTWLIWQRAVFQAIQEARLRVLTSQKTSEAGHSTTPPAWSVGIYHDRFQAKKVSLAHQQTLHVTSLNLELQSGSGLKYRFGPQVVQLSNLENLGVALIEWATNVEAFERDLGIDQRFRPKRIRYQLRPTALARSYFSWIGAKHRSQKWRAEELCKSLLGKKSTTLEIP